MPSQRTMLGAVLAALMLIGAISVFLDLKSRSDARLVHHTLEVLRELSDARLLIARAESVARGFVLTNDPHLAAEYRDTLDQIEPAFSNLIEITKDSPNQT